MDVVTDLAALLGDRTGRMLVVDGRVQSTSTTVTIVRTPHGWVGVETASNISLAAGTHVRLAHLDGTWVILHTVGSGWTETYDYETLVNPGFEEAALVGWTQYEDPQAFTRSTSSPIYGTASGLLDAANAPFTTVVANDPVQVVPGTWQTNVNGIYTQVGSSSADRIGTVTLEAWTAPSLSQINTYNDPATDRYAVATKVDNLWPQWNLTGTFTVPPTRRWVRLALVYSLASNIIAGQSLRFDNFYLLRTGT